METGPFQDPRTLISTYPACMLPQRERTTSEARQTASPAGFSIFHILLFQPGGPIRKSSPSRSQSHLISMWRPGTLNEHTRILEMSPIARRNGSSDCLASRSPSSIPSLTALNEISLLMYGMITLKAPACGAFLPVLSAGSAEDLIDYATSVFTSVVSPVFASYTLNVHPPFILFRALK